MWIIGIDEQTGHVHPVGDDVESWWPQVMAEFDDGVFPTFRTHRLVRLTEDEFVLALAFDTEDAPYVLKPHAPGRDREVPIRTATAVRSGEAARASASDRTCCPDAGEPRDMGGGRPLESGRTGNTRYSGSQCVCYSARE